MIGFTIQENGSVVVVIPETDESSQWIQENVYLEDWQWMGRGFVIDTKFTNDLIDGMVMNGFEVAID